MCLSRGSTPSAFISSIGCCWPLQWPQLPSASACEGCNDKEYRLKFSDQLLGCKLSVRLGRVVIRCHDAAHLVAPDDRSSTALSGNGRPPAPRFALVGDYRKLG